MKRKEMSVWKVRAGAAMKRKEMSVWIESATIDVKVRGSVDECVYSKLKCYCRCEGK